MAEIESTATGRRSFSGRTRFFLDDRNQEHLETREQLENLIRENAVRLPLWRSHGHAEAVTHLAFDTGGTILATGSEDGSIVFWDGDGNFFANPVKHTPTTQAISGLVWSPGGDRLLSASVDGSIALWGPGGESAGEALGLPSAPVSPAWSASGDYFASVLKRLDFVGRDDGRRFASRIFRPDLERRGQAGPAAGEPRRSR